MENLLNKSHPFRATVTHEASSAAPVAAAPAEAAAEAGARPGIIPRNWFNTLSLKKKLGLIALLGGIIGYGYVSLYDLTNSSGRPAAKKKRVEQAAVVSVDPQREELGGRTVEGAWKKAGIFHRLFCRGGEKRSFCE